MLVARWLWRELGLENILDGLAPKTSRVQKAGRLPFADRVLLLVANRLCRPSSEHALAQWLESDFVCGRDGKRILARWKQQGRVRVDLNWLQEWYRTLDQLLAHKERIEVELFARLRDLFHLKQSFGLKSALTSGLYGLSRAECPGQCLSVSGSAEFPQ